jgi:hypothetical protein
VQEYAVHILIAMGMIVTMIMAVMGMTVLEAEDSDQVDCKASNADDQ